MGRGLTRKNLAVIVAISAIHLTAIEGKSSKSILDHLSNFYSR